MHIDLKQQEQKKCYDRARRVAVKYKYGDLVLIRITSDPVTGSSKKLHPKFEGLFQVQKVLINNRYEIKNLREGCRQCKRTVQLSITVDHDSERRRIQALQLKLIDNKYQSPCSCS